MDLSPELALALLAYLPQGVLLLDLSGDEPQVLYANAPNDTPTAADVVGPVSLATLMGWQAGGSEVADLVLRLDSGEPVTLAVPRDNGTVPLQLLPLPRANGGRRYYIGLEHAADPIAERAALAGLPIVVRDDRLTGLAHRDWFWELYRRDFRVAAREHRPLSVFVVDVDALGSYNDTFGRSAGDSLIRLVGRALHSGMRRASDIVARDSGGRYIALASGQSLEQVRRHAELLAARVRDLHLHHPRSGIARFVTVSIGAGHWDAKPGPAEAPSPESLYAAAVTALAQSRRDGRNRVSVVSLGA